jgi:hypothetical protein
MMMENKTPDNDDVQIIAHDHIRGVREANTDDPVLIAKREQMREAKIKAAHEGNPYPNKLRD